LKELIREKEVFGLIVLDANEANIGLLKGKILKQLKRLESRVPGKTIKGGMSQRRYDRLREDALHEFLTKVGEVSSQLLLKEPELRGTIIGGPGPVKDTFVKGKYLHYKIKKKLLGTKDTGYTGEEGLDELVKRSYDLIEKSSVVKEKELLEKFFSELQKEGNVVYGKEETQKALEEGAVDILLISESLEDLVEDLSEKAKQYGTKVELVSVDTPEGVQFKELGGIGGLLRYKAS
jgi:peptide chain release factor subunit 1